MITQTTNKRKAPDEDDNRIIKKMGPKEVVSEPKVTKLESYISTEIELDRIFFEEINTLFEYMMALTITEEMSIDLRTTPSTNAITSSSSATTSSSSAATVTMGDSTDEYYDEYRDDIRMQQAHPLMKYANAQPNAQPNRNPESVFSGFHMIPPVKQFSQGQNPSRPPSTPFGVFGALQKHNMGPSMGPSKGGMGITNYQSLTSIPKPPILYIYMIKLLKELSHDFSLKKMKDIKQNYLEYLTILADNMHFQSYRDAYISNPNNSANDKALVKLFGILYEETGEWSYYKNILEYYLEECNGFNNITMIKYRSVENTGSTKGYLLRSMNMNPGDPSVTELPLFNAADFKYNLPDNAMNMEIIWRLIHRTGIDSESFKNSILTIQNLPSLIDPATTNSILIEKFYKTTNGVDPQNDLDFKFRKCQDPNNFFDENNKHIREILCEGINIFFKLFNAQFDYAFPIPSSSSGPTARVYKEHVTTNNATFDEYKINYDNCPVKFTLNIVGGDITLAYYDKLKELNTNGGEQTLIYRYNGIRIKTGSEKFIDLQVGDTTINNITALVDAEIYIHNFLKHKETQNPTNRLINPIWERLCIFAYHILKSSSIFKANTDLKVLFNNLRFIIICLKAFGDWFQAFYTSALSFSEKLRPQFSDVLLSMYLSGSDKNTTADKMIMGSDTVIGERLITGSKFVCNGCGIRPYESLHLRYPKFFDTDLINFPIKGDLGTSIPSPQILFGDRYPIDNDIENRDTYQTHPTSVTRDPLVPNLGSVKAVFMNTPPSGINYQPIIENLIVAIRQIVSTPPPTTENPTAYKQILIELVAPVSPLITYDGILTITSQQFDAPTQNILHNILHNLKNTIDSYKDVRRKFESMIDELDKQNKLILEKVDELERKKKQPSTGEMEKLSEKLLDDTSDITKEKLEKIFALQINKPTTPAGQGLVRGVFTMFVNDITTVMNKKKQDLAVFVKQLSTYNTSSRQSSRFGPTAMTQFIEKASNFIRIQGGMLRKTQKKNRHKTNKNVIKKNKKTNNRHRRNNKTHKYFHK